MRKPPAHPCPVCGKARTRLPDGTVTVLCARCWGTVPDHDKGLFQAAGKAFQHSPKTELAAMRTARAALIEAAKTMKQQQDLFA